MFSAKGLTMVCPRDTLDLFRLAATPGVPGRRGVPIDWHTERGLEPVPLFALLVETERAATEIRRRADAERAADAAALPGMRQQPELLIKDGRAMAGSIVGVEHQSHAVRRAACNEGMTDMKWARRTLIPLTAVVGLVTGAVPGVAQVRPPLQIVELESLGGATSVAAVSRAGMFIAGVALTASGQQAHTVRWDVTGRITDLDPGADSSQVFGVNDAGTVVGIRYSAEVGSETTGAVWDRDGRMTVLVPPSSSGIDQWVQPAGINNAGEVAGTVAQNSVGAVYAVRWDRRGVATRLPGRWNDDGAAAVAISERGDVIGVVGTSSLEPHGARWDRKGRLTDLGPLPGDTLAEATAVNSRGEVVGFSAKRDGERHPVKWDSAGNAVRLASLPGQGGSEVAAIADDGTVVGIVDIVTGPDSHHFRAVRWDSHGAVMDLDVLVGDTDCGSISAPSRDGSIVGWSSTPPYGPRHAVLWDRRGAITNLGTLPGDTDSWARFIARNGLIIGDSWGADKVTHAVMWRKARRP